MKRAAFFLSLLASSAYGGSIGTPSIGDVVPDPANVVSRTLGNPGMFLLDPVNNVINNNCIASGTGYLLPGSNGVFPNCSSNPPPANQVFITAPQPGVGFTYDFANLGITAAQYALAAAYANNSSIPQSNLLKQIGQASSLGVVGGELQYSFTSANLPTALTGEIPGSGIYMHFQNVLPYNPIVYPFAASNSAYVNVRAIMGVPTYVQTGSATMNITISISFQQLNTSGTLEPISCLIAVFNSIGAYSESASTDGRNEYLQGYVYPGAQFITTRSSYLSLPTSGDQYIGFQITNANMSALIAALNVKLAAMGSTLLSTNLATVRLHEYDIRTEAAKLDIGTITEVLNAQTLQVTAVNPALAY